MILLLLRPALKIAGYLIVFALLLVVLAECGVFGRLEQPAMEPDQYRHTDTGHTNNDTGRGGAHR